MGILQLQRKGDRKTQADGYSEVFLRRGNRKRSKWERLPPLDLCDSPRRVGKEEEPQQASSPVYSRFVVQCIKQLNLICGSIKLTSSQCEAVYTFACTPVITSEKFLT